MAGAALSEGGPRRPEEPPAARRQPQAPGRCWLTAERRHQGGKEDGEWEGRRGVREGGRGGEGGKEGGSWMLRSWNWECG